MKRWDALAEITPLLGNSLVVTCNGMLGRDLWAIGDQPNQFYMIGSMGLASSIGLGLAIAQPKKRVVILDGDGNVLMNLGGLANIGAHKPANLYHFILDNGTHASTGDKKTVSRSVPLEEIARSCAYRHVARVRGGVEKAAKEMLAGEGPACLLIEVEPGNQPKVPRVGIGSPAMAQRFRQASMK